MWRERRERAAWGLWSFLLLAIRVPPARVGESHTIHMYLSQTPCRMWLCFWQLFRARTVAHCSSACETKCRAAYGSGRTDGRTVGASAAFAEADIAAGCVCVYRP